MMGQFIQKKWNNLAQRDGKREDAKRIRMAERPKVSKSNPEQAPVEIEKLKMG